MALHAEEWQRWQAEAALRASEERFRALVENSSDALLLIDAEGRITYLSPSSERHLGWAPEQLVGRSIFDFLHTEDRELVGARLVETLGHPAKPINAQVRFHHADGSWRIMDGVGVNRLNDPAVAASSSTLATSRSGADSKSSSVRRRRWRRSVSSQAAWPTTSTIC